MVLAVNIFIELVPKRTGSGPCPLYSWVLVIVLEKKWSNILTLATKHVL